MKLYLLYFFTIPAFMACNAGDSLVLVNNGRSDFSIIVDDDADSIEMKSAAILRHYLKAMTEADLPVVHNSTAPEKGMKIYIGSNALINNTELSANQMFIATSRGAIYLAGGNPMYTLYSVYTFLEKYTGCRFYAPDAEIIPEHEILYVPGNIRYTYIPDITTRTVHSRLFYDNPEFADKRKVTHEAFPRYVPTARVHTFHVFMPEDVFFASHPEYYALRNGRRLPTQLCLSNPDVFHHVRDSVGALLKRYPEAEVISVSQDDNGQYCECNDCMQINEREGSPSGSVIDFVNRIADEFPEVMVSTLAYQYTRKAPANLRPRSNVLITLCSIECDRSAPIGDKCVDFATDLSEWGAISDNIRIWDYTTQFTNFLAPFPNLHTLQPNIQLFRDNNARWIFEQHSHQPSELFELRSYLTSVLLWDPDVDADSVVAGFLNGYYADAGPYIQQYIDHVHGALREDPDFFLFLYGDPSQAFGSWLRADLLSQFDALFDSAEMAVKEDHRVLERVKRARLGIDYASLEASRKNLSDQYSLTGPDGNINNRLLQKLAGFREICQTNDIDYMNEMRLTVAEYLDLYEKTLERAVKPNLATGRKVVLDHPATKYAGENPQVLTDGSFGGSSFYANWLGFEGNDLAATIDLENDKEISEINIAFLQVTNHMVFFPLEVTCYISVDGDRFIPLGKIRNSHPLSRDSKTNDIQVYSLSFAPVKARFVKVLAENQGTAPYWHFGAGMPCWIFADEIGIR